MLSLRKSFQEKGPAAGDENFGDRYTFRFCLERGVFWLSAAAPETMCHEP